MKFVPHDYQKRAIQKIIEQDRVGLFLDMGLGKTVITLTAVQDLMYDRFDIKKALVIAPKRVAEDTWTREHEKWDHLKGLKISKVIGTPAAREAALKTEADIYVIGRDSVVWLVNYYGRNWPFDMIVIDELSSFKNPQSKRFKALRKVIGASDRVVGLTGTPSPNGLMDLWAEIYLLDRGTRLGRTIGEYRNKYFRPGAMNGYVVYRWDALPGADRKIEKLISDLCVSMSAAEYLKLPKRIDNEVRVALSDQEMKMYKTMERDQILSLGDDEVAAYNAATVMMKLLQMANGTVYGENDEAHIHDKKAEALEDIAECTDGSVLVFYSYKHDLKSIKAKFPNARCLDSEKDIKDWNAGKIKMLLAHPAAVGYGLNLQDGGHTIVWYGLTWSLELYQQANARLHRQGQEKPVIVHHIIASGTVDEQVMKAIKKKDLGQAALLSALKERR